MSIQHLVTKVAAVSGPADGHGRAADLALGDPEIRDLLHLRDELREEGARARSLQGQRPDLGADVLDRHVHLADPVREVGEVRFGRGQQVLVTARVEDHPVLDDEATVVEPTGVLRVARFAGADVAGKDAAQERFGVLAGDPVLEERAGVEKPRRIAHREVLELVRHLVAVRRQVPGPVAPQLRLVERRRALVEGRGADHAVVGPLRGCRYPGTISAIGRVRNMVLRCEP